MKRYWTVIGLVLLFFLSTFLLVQQISPSFLANPFDLMAISSINSMLIGVGLLVADIIITRPVPILAETTVIMAGASTMRWQAMSLATLAGSLPVAVLYALTGATAASFDNAILAFALVLLMAVVMQK